MVVHSDVSLHAATTADAAVLSNLLELYIHDLSAIFPNLALGSDGRFGYRRLPLYWSEPDRRFAFLIRCGGELAGFALATHGSPVPTEPNAMDVAEFFVLRRHRGAGVGRRAAHLLWNRFPGRWTVRVAAAHHEGLAFWRGAIAEAVGTPVVPSSHVAASVAWQVFAFEPRPLALAE